MMEVLAMAIEKHDKYTELILSFDFNEWQEHSNTINAERRKLEDEYKLQLKEFNKLKVLVNRVSYFEAILDNWVANGRITPEKKQAYIKYIELAQNEKISAECFEINDIVTKHKKELGFKDDDLNLWPELNIIGKKVDSDEVDSTLTELCDEDYARFQHLQKTLPDLSRQISECEEKEKHNNQILKDFFKPEDITSIEDINKVCEDTNGQVELLIIRNGKVDVDLAAVIQMRAQISKEKGNKLIVLSMDQFTNLIAQGPIANVTKLSFLHHSTFSFGYEENISEYINKLPDLKELVLRGCGTVPGSETNSDIEFVVTKTETSYENKAQILGTNQIVLQQKDMGETGILTKISWNQQMPDGSYSRQEREFMGMEKITSKKLTDKQLQALEKLVETPLLKYSDAYKKEQREIINKSSDHNITSEQYKSMKQSLRRMRTETVKSVKDLKEDDSLMHDILGNMTDEQKNRVAVKAYVGGYKVVQGKVIPDIDHGRSTESKAIRVSSK